MTKQLSNGSSFLIQQYLSSSWMHDQTDKGGLKKEEIIHASLKLWCALTNPYIFKIYQLAFISIFK